MTPSKSCVTLHPPTPMVDNVDDYEYLYLTEALSSYPKCYTTEWNELFENIKTHVCDDISSYFFNPTKPLLPLDTLIPNQPQNINVGDNKGSYKLVIDESNNQVIIVTITPSLDSYVKQRKRVRRKKARRVTDEFDVAAPSSLQTPQEVNEAPNEKTKNHPKSSSRNFQV